MRFALSHVLSILALSACGSESQADTSGLTAAGTGGAGAGTGGGVGDTWIAIPQGEFSMGCSPGDGDCFPDEEPAHMAQISAFEMRETEITQSEYEAFAGANPSGFAGCADCPVDGVTWEQARLFCEAAGGRLPTEAEWEYAARGGATTRYPCGDDPACLDAIAWYATNAGSETHPVRTKAPNAFGLHDMIGNVLELVSDTYDAGYYATSPAIDPQGPVSGTRHVLRGGVWGFTAQFMRVSLRNHDGEPIVEPAYRGFRCAR